MKTQQAGTMFRPAGIVVVQPRFELLRSLLGWLGWLGRWLSLSRLGWLRGFLGGGGFWGSFLRGHFLGSFWEDFGHQFGVHVASLWYPVREETRNRDTQQSDDSSLKLAANRTARIVEVFVNCVKRNLLNHNTLSKVGAPQLPFDRWKSGVSEDAPQFAVVVIA